jgi:hypothetical protein
MIDLIDGWTLDQHEQCIFSFESFVEIIIPLHIQV